MSLSGVGVLADHLLVVSCSATTTYLCWLCRSPLPDKKGYFVCLLAMTFLPVTVCVLSLFIPHGMHLVIPTHHYFFWVVCHPSRTFPPKELEQEPQNRFSSLPTVRPYPLTSDPWPTTSCIGWVQANEVWALRMLDFCMCPKAACYSRVSCGLEACLHILSFILDF